MTAENYGIVMPLFNLTYSNQAFYVSLISVTVGDLVMSDGNRLEGVGVSPGYPVGPSSLALSNRTDPVKIRVIRVMRIMMIKSFIYVLIAIKSPMNH